MAEVYWIRLPEHTYMFTQGYIGVTKNDAKARFRGHLQEAKLRDCKTSHLHNYLNKHGREGLVVQTLVICEIEYAFELEEKLRPSERVGWNVAKGGIKAVNPGGYKLSEETRKKMSDSFKTGNRKPVGQEVYDKLSAQMKGISRGPLSKEVVSKRERTRFLKMWEASPSVWSRCDVWYEFYIHGMGLARACERAYKETLGSLTPVFSRFKMGWVPHEDSDWLKLFKETSHGTLTDPY